MRSSRVEGLSLTWEGAKRYLSQLPNEESGAWDVFVSYASEDQEAVARPLATLLSDLGLRVWYDEMELRVGDRLRRKIDAGLARCRFGVVILSESFFGKHYPESELDGLAQREQDGRDLILPVWHDVDVETVRRHSPRLADRVALKWQDGIDTVVEGLLRVIAPDLLRDVIERDRELTEYVDQARVPRITSGEELTALLGTYGFFFSNDELRDEAVDLVGGFQQELFDWSEIWDDLGPRRQAEAASHLAELLEGLHEQGWTVHGRLGRKLAASGGSPVKGPVSVLVVVRGRPRGVMELGEWSYRDRTRRRQVAEAYVVASRHGVSPIGQAVYHSDCAFRSVRVSGGPPPTTAATGAQACSGGVPRGRHMSYLGRAPGSKRGDPRLKRASEDVHQADQQRSHDRLRGRVVGDG